MNAASAERAAPQYGSVSGDDIRSHDLPIDMLLVSNRFPQGDRAVAAVSATAARINRVQSSLVQLDRVRAK